MDKGIIKIVKEEILGITCEKIFHLGGKVSYKINGQAVLGYTLNGYGYRNGELLLTIVPLHSEKRVKTTTNNDDSKAKNSKT